MKIINDSIVDLSSKFKHLQQHLEGMNYTISLEVKKFKYLDNNFEMKNLKSLFPNENIEGEIYKSSLKDAQRDIFKAMSYFSYISGLVAITSDNLITKTRESWYWEALENIFKLPPNKVYKHEAVDKSYFGFYVMWGFCYIFLNNNEGLVIAGQSWD